MKTTPYCRNATHALPMTSPLTDSRLERIRRMTLMAVSVMLDAEGIEVTGSIQSNGTASSALRTLVGMMEDSGDIEFTGDVNGPDPIFDSNVQAQMTHIAEILPHSDRDLAFIFAIRALSESDPTKADAEAKEAVLWASRAAVSPPPRRCGYPDCKAPGDYSTKAGSVYCVDHIEKAEKAERLGG